VGVAGYRPNRVLSLDLAPSYKFSSHLLEIFQKAVIPARVQDQDPTLALLLSDALESPANGPPEGAKADLAKLQSLQERIFRNRTRLLDRFNQLPLYGKPRKDAKEGNRCQWKLSGTGGDHPLVQMILSLRQDEEDLEGMASEMERKDWVRSKLAIKAKIADLLLALQKENDQVYAEMQDVLNMDQRQKEHKDKMNLAANRKDEDGSDAELIAKATALGIPLNGDS
jgi:hypothetical protein